MHLAYHFQRAAQRYARRVALVDRGRTWTYAEFVGRILRVGQALHGIGLARGDRVAILLPDTHEYLETDYGAMAAGLVRVPLDPRLNRRELVAQLADAGARALVFGEASADRVVDLPGDLPDLRCLVQVGGAIGRRRDGRARGRGGAPLRLRDVARRRARRGPACRRRYGAGRPELHGRHHRPPQGGDDRARNLAAIVQNVLAGRPVYADDAFLNVRPLWPIASVLVLVQILGGATVVLGGRFQAARFLTQLQRHRVTATSLVPTLLIRLLDQTDPRQHDLSALRTIDHGAAAIPPEVFARRSTCSVPA